MLAMEFKVDTFFTVNLLERRLDTLVRHVDALREPGRVRTAYLLRALPDFTVEELLWKAGRHLSDQPTDIRLELRVQVKGAVDEQTIDGLIECLGCEQTDFTRKQKNTNITH